jgi:hypothetical protein
VPEAARAGALLRSAVEAAFAPGNLVTCELGGDADTGTVFAAVGSALERADA